MRINPKKRFDNLIEWHGHDIIYGRRNKKFRCKCYSERSGEATRYCGQCLGTGYRLDLMKQKVRRQQASIPATLPNFLEYEAAGSFHNETMTFYMKSDTNPQNGDIIFEVDWKNGNRRAKAVENKFMITVVDAKMANNKEVQFYQVYTRKIVKGDEDDDTVSRADI